MNIWLLGNGFDLAHTLPTKYENFIHTMEFLIEHKDEQFKTVGEIFSNKELQDKDELIAQSYYRYSEAYNKVPMSVWYNQLQSYEDDYKCDYMSNPWLQYFIKCFNQVLGWIDFEKEIASVVDAFKSLLKIDDITFNLEGLYGSLNPERRHIIESFDFFYTKGKMNKSVGTINKEYISSKAYGFKVNKEKIVDDLYSSLRAFAFLLRLYLMVFVEYIMDCNLDGAIEFKALERADKIISFNYTHTVEKLYKKTDVCHIHGIADKVVLGINSDEDDSVDSVDTLFLNFKKYFQRVRYNTDVDYLKAIDRIKVKKENGQKTLAGEKVQLTVVGHSLDVTDEDIIKELFDLADEIVINYHENNMVGTYIKNLVNIYGREGFDNLRKNKYLTFKNLKKESKSNNSQ